MYSDYRTIKRLQEYYEYIHKHNIPENIVERILVVDGATILQLTATDGKTKTDI